MDMKLSIVISTLGRVAQLQDLLVSIARFCADVKLEVLIVDQNAEDLLKPLTGRSWPFPLVRYCVPFKGLSKARNYGVDRAKGEYVIFADDDMEMLSGGIERAIEVLDARPDLIAVSGKMVNRQGKPVVAKWSDSAAELSYKRFYGFFVEACLLFRRVVFDRFRFDERLGVGCYHGAEEGADLIYRLLLEKCRLYYDPKICFYHPEKTGDRGSEDVLRRVRSYARGYAGFCLANRLWSRLAWKIALCIGYSFAMAPVRPVESRYYRAKGLGMIEGWWNWPPRPDGRV